MNIIQLRARVAAKFSGIAVALLFCFFLVGNISAQEKSDQKIKSEAANDSWWAERGALFFPRYHFTLQATNPRIASGDNSRISAPNAIQATFTWDGGGGDNNWGTAGNWTVAGVPTQPGTGADDLHFAGGLRLTPNMQASYNINSLTFDSGASSFTLGNTGGTTLTIQGGGITNNDNSLQTINISDITMGAAQTWSAASTGSLTISSNVDNGGNLLTISGSSTGVTTLTGVISGSGGLTKNGTGTLTLNGANNFGGNVTLNTGGTLNIGNASALGTGTFVIGGVATFNNTSGSALTIANAFTLSGGSPTFTGTDDLTIGGAVTLSGANRTITVSASTLTLNGVVGESGSRSLTKAGAGTLVLNGNNTFSGGLTLSAGTLVFGHNNAAGSGTLTLNAGTVQGTGGARTIGNNLSIGGDITFSGSENLTFTDSFDQGAGRIYTVNNTTEFSGDITGGDSLTKSGTGTLILSGNNTIDTVTVNSGGALRVANNGALGTTGSGTTVNSGGALELIGGRTIGAEALSLNGTGVSNGGALRNISGDNSWAGTITLANVTGVHRINSDSGTLTISGGITEASNNNNKDLTFGGAGNVTVTGNITATAGDMRLFKDGSGTLILAGANTYDGATTVSGGGTLLVNNTSGSGTGTGSVTVNGSGTTLGGTGTISGSVTLGNTTPGAVLNPGPKGANGTSASVGTLTVGALTLTGSNIFHIDAFGTAAGNWDKLVVTTLGVTLGTTSTLELSIASSLTFTNGSTYTLIDKTSAGAISGTFSNAADGSTVTFDGYSFLVDYQGGTGNDFVLTAVPEPATWVSGALVAGVLSWTQRQRFARLVRRVA